MICDLASAAATLDGGFAWAILAIIALVIFGGNDNGKRR